MENRKQSINILENLEMVGASLDVVQLYHPDVSEEDLQELAWRQEPHAFRQQNHLESDLQQHDERRHANYCLEVVAGVAADRSHRRKWNERDVKQVQ